MATIIEWRRAPPGASSNKFAIWPVAAKRFAIFAMSGYQTRRFCRSVGRPDLT